MAAADDYYKELGVARNATEEDIQKAYRALVPKFHPDLNPGDDKIAARFKEINRAYETLKNPTKRKEYDESLRIGGAAPGGATGGRRQQSAARGAGGHAAAAGPVGGPMSGNPLGDILDAMRGNARSNAGASDGQAAAGATGGAPTVDIYLTPHEAIEGTTKTIRVNGRLLKIRIRIRR